MHRVKSIALFGSAAKDSMHENSDIDFLVQFSDEIDVLDYADNYFSFLEKLENLIGKKVDLVSKKSLKNPVLIEEIDRSKVDLYPKVLKYILDIQSVIQEIETIKTKTNNNFNSFKSDIILQRAIERDLEIIGEAIRKILEIDPTIKITSAKNIIGLRNIISHAYDSIEPEMVWGIIQNNIPLLADEINTLKTI